MEVNRPGDVVTYTGRRARGCSVEFLFCDRCNMAGGHDDDCWEWQVGELRRQLAAANERAERLEKAVRWALGGPGSDFRGRNEGEGQFYWRTDLAKLAGLAWDNEAGDYREVPDAHN